MPLYAQHESLTILAVPGRMSDQETPVGYEPLQFDRVITESASSAAPERLAVVCEACQASIDTEYYHVNGITCCSRCRDRFESAAETPRGVAPLVRGGAFGLGAGIVGAAIYYAVIAIAHLEIGIVAILIGYLVGRGVRKGARGRGGLRFQILAVALTYASVALAYTPIAIEGMLARDRQAQQTAASASGASSPVAAPTAAERSTTPVSGSRLVLGLAFLLAFILALPMLIVFGSLPSGLLSALIIGIGMRQAASMTGAPRLEVFGPYRVGAGSAFTAT